MEIERSLRSGFLASVERWPDNEALRVHGRSFVYGEVCDTARRWATRLADMCDGPPRRVGILGYRSHTSYVGVLAALLAGASFVPFNPNFPDERTRAMLEQADVDALIVDESGLSTLGALAGLARRPAVLAPATPRSRLVSILTEPALSEDDLVLAPPLVDLPPVRGDDHAYLLFTSGSTGVPKGVPVTQANVCSFLETNGRRYGLTPEDRLTQTFDQTFDLSVFDLFMAWQSGACSCAMRPLELVSPFRYLQENGITVWFSVPSVARLLLKRGTLRAGRMPTLRWSLFCGEKLTREVAETWQDAAPKSAVENLYGPTELTIACAAYRWERTRSGQECVGDVVPIGEIYQGLPHIVVDENLHVVKAGEIGELCVAGAQTWPGYWRRPDLTSDRCFEAHDGTGSVCRYYRTGDLVRWTGAHYVYVGRNDEQVKIGGYRIELGEIECVAREVGCLEAVALVGPDPENPQYVDLVVSGLSKPPEALKGAVSERLPKYMCPRSIHVAHEMPLNSNGKIDRSALRTSVAEVAITSEAPAFLATREG